MEDKGPQYDAKRKLWRVVTEWGEEEGDAMYIASELIKGGVIYPFHCEPPEKETHHDHAHGFYGVVEYLLGKPEYFSIEGFEEYYSKQEIKMLEALKEKLVK